MVGSFSNMSTKDREQVRKHSLRKRAQSVNSDGKSIDTYRYFSLVLIPIITYFPHNSSQVFPKTDVKKVQSFH